jgi:hypothetical protein
MPEPERDISERGASMRSARIQARGQLNNTRSPLRTGVRSGYGRGPETRLWKDWNFGWLAGASGKGSRQEVLRQEV